MLKVVYKDLEYFQFSNLSAFTELKHFISTRKGGRSKAPYDALNISYHKEVSEIVQGNRELLAESQAARLDQFCFAYQVHGNSVEQVGENDRGKGAFGPADAIPDTDALVSGEAGVGLVVSSADCVPLLFYDPVNRVIGAAHSGWRGTVKKIAIQTIEQMRKQHSSDIQDIRVGVGPCISVSHYEVGLDVVEAVEEAFGQRSPYLVWNAQSEKYHLNLSLTNRKMLENYGILPQHIEESGLCTYQHEEYFYSYRRDGKACGIFASGIILQEEKE